MNKTAFLLPIICLLPYLAQAQPATIGALAELTGTYARLGQDCQHGYEIARESLPSTTKVLYGDNQNDPKAAISEYRRLVDTEHASTIVTTRSPVGLALNPLSSKQKIPLIGIVGHPRFISENPYAIRAYPSAADEAQALASHINTNQREGIAIITAEDEYLVGLAEEVKKLLPPEKIVFSETVSPTEHDFALLLSRVKAKAPKTVIVNVGPSQIISLIKKLHELQLHVDIYSNFLIGAADIRKGLAEQAEGIVFAELDYEKPNFINAIREKTGNTDISPIGYSCYIALTYALTLNNLALSKHISTAQAQPEIHEISTLDGPIKFIAREAKLTIIPKILRNGAPAKIQ